MDKVKGQWIYYRLMLHERFVGFKRIKSGQVSQYSEYVEGPWGEDVIFHDDGVKIDNPFGVHLRN